MRTVLSLSILTFLPFIMLAQHVSSSPSSQATASPSAMLLSQAPAPTDEQIRAWIQQNLPSKQSLPPSTAPLQPAVPKPAELPTLDQLIKLLELQKQQDEALQAQTAAKATAQYQSCIATERAKLTSAANSSQTPASTQNQINNTSNSLSKKSGGLFNLNDMLRQMQLNAIEAKAAKNCKALLPPSPAAAPKQQQ